MDLKGQETMNLIVCLDNQNGMSFNYRRQSRDRAVIEKIAELVGEELLHTSTYSTDLLKGFALNIDAADDYLQSAEEGYFFVERENVRSYMHTVRKVYIFRWNRDYPSDLFFPMDIVLSEFIKKDRCDIAGNSHDTITLEVYER